MASRAWKGLSVPLVSSTVQLSVVGRSVISFPKVSVLKRETKGASHTVPLLPLSFGGTKKDGKSLFLRDLTVSYG